MTRPVLGVAVAALTQEEAVERLIAFHHQGRPHLVVTPNPEILYAARSDPELRSILQGADLALPDGFGIVLAGRLVGRPFPARVTGIDLAWDLLGRLSNEARVFLLGSRPGVAEAAAVRLQAVWPGLSIVGTHSGYFNPEEEGSLLVRLRELRPTILLAGLGSPRQEQWLSRHYRDIGAAINLGVGGSFDVWSGQVPRAPIFWRRLGLEWLYRLYREPWRYRRMLVLPKFLWAVIWQRSERGRP